MDQQKFMQLLQTIQIPDTDKVKAATSELRKTYYPHPQSLLWLLQILTSHDSPQIRQQGAVEALRLVPKHWGDLPDAQKPAIREQLLKTTLEEETVLVRHSQARVVSAIAGLDLADGEWSELPGLLAKASTSTQVKHREVGVYILFTLLEVAGDGFTDKFSSLFSLFSKTIQDQESQEVRINTMLALSRMAILIEPEEDPQSLESFRDLFPAMVAVLKKAVEDNDEARTMQAFEVFQTLLGCESALLAKHFGDLMQFMIEIAVEPSIVDDSRSQAISFLMQCVKYRRMKVQGIQGMGEQLTTKSMQIVSEISDDDDDEDDVNPARSALSLLDLLASSLPPRQVVIPLLKELPQYVKSDNPTFRRAGILSLGMCVEGAPDLMSTQLSGILQIALELLHDPDTKVRGATLIGITRLADELGEEMSKEHAVLIPALLKNLETAMRQAGENSTTKIVIGMITVSCTALESLIDGMNPETIGEYSPTLVPLVGRLFGHPDLTIKARGAGLMGAIAGASEGSFEPYFKSTIESLSEYVIIKDSEDELVLRAAVCDAVGRIATAVGGTTFQPYVKPLMHASEEALHLGDPRLRETSYILWSTLAKIYEEDFTPFLDGVVKGLLESLQQEESDLEVEVGEDGSDLVGKEVTVSGKKLKVTSAAAEIDDLNEFDEFDDLDDWDDLEAVTAVALEKEISTEVIADILTHTRENFVPYLEKTVEIVLGLVEHPYEGVRKAAIGTLWRSYACLWEMMEKRSGKKWEPGIPLKQQPTQELIKLGEIVAIATMKTWGDEVDRGVVTDINRNIADTLTLCGPAILAHENMLAQVTTVLAAILTRQHPCQMDLGDDEDQDSELESSEYDWLVVETALDVVVGLATALGEQFGELWKVFEKPIMKMASAQDAGERSTATGAIGECIAGMGNSVTPSTEKLLRLLLHRLSDEDPDTKSNAAFGIGILIENSGDSTTYLPNYNAILTKLEPLMSTEESQDNAAGCVSRMIMAHPANVPIEQVIPAIVGLLPLKTDYDENKPIYNCIIGLYQHNSPVIRELTPDLIPVFAQVLSPPAEQLDDETREKVLETVRYLAKENPSLVRSNEVLSSALSG